MTLESRTACFCGYRPEEFSFILKKGHKAYFILEHHISQTILQAVDHGYTRFLCGMIKGFDLTAGVVLAELRKKREHMRKVELVAVLPYVGYGFDDPWQIIYQMVIAQADEVITLAPACTRETFLAHNRYIIDKSTRLICYYEGNKDDMKYTIEYARKKQREIINLKTYDMITSPRG
ncbi:hypothetical protein C4J81_16600 [Deltaproteobacteria bacterium Smac51]|nr:hypothetical protein C4J81_16600 [Deltaproteobacteria bacterium Smac51]